MASHTTTTSSSPITHHITKTTTPLLLDGGLATHLETLGACFTGTPAARRLWSASLLSTNPALIRQAHLDYFLAGADVAITASYQGSTRGLMEGLSISEAEAMALVRVGVECAKNARADAMSLIQQKDGRARQLYVAGSIGPYAAYLADGSEYTGAYDPLPSHEEMKLFHRPRIQALAQAGVDGFAVETFPRLDEIVAVLEVLQEEEEAASVPCWVSVTLDSTGTRMADGTPLSRVCEIVKSHERVVAIGVNCVARDVVARALSVLRESMQYWKEAERKALVVYPNSGEVWDGVRKVWMKGEGQKGGKGIEDWMSEWMGGVRRDGSVKRMIIGGCCRVEPEEIGRMRVWLDNSA